MPTAPASPTPSDAGENAKMRIGFFASFPFHREILAPIHALLQGEFPCLMTDDVQAIIGFQPRVLFVSDRFLPRYRQQLPDTLLIYTRHGFISKDYAWGVFGESDFVCVSSLWVRDDCVQRGWLPQMGYWITGYVPMDPVLADRAAQKPPELPPGFSRTGPTLLYAPTFNRLLNSVEMLGTDWIRRLRERQPDLNIILKPHPHIAQQTPDVMAILQELAASNERTLLVPGDADVYALLPMADVLLSDASSVPFYFLALNRPIILVNNPRRFEEPRFFDPNGMEWTWRDMAIEIEQADALPGAFQACLDRPDEKAETRLLYRSRVFGDLLDGCGAARIAQHVRALLKPAPQDQAWAETVWYSARTIGKLRSMTSQENPPPPGRVVVDLGKYPHLRSAVKQQPVLRAELMQLVGAALRERPGAHRPPQEATPPRAPAKNV